MSVMGGVSWVSFGVVLGWAWVGSLYEITNGVILVNVGVIDTVDPDELAFKSSPLTLRVIMLFDIDVSVSVEFE